MVLMLIRNILNKTIEIAISPIQMEYNKLKRGDYKRLQILNSK